MTKLKIFFTLAALVVVMAYGYQYLPSRTEQEQRDALTLIVTFVPLRIGNSDPFPIGIDTYVYGKAPQKYHRDARISPFPMTILGASAGDRILFAAYRDAPLVSLTCEIKRHGNRVRYNDKPTSGMVNCDWIVA